MLARWMLILAVLTLAGTFVVPEVRKHFHLEKPAREVVAESRRHFEEGQRLAAQGRYADAQREYQTCVDGDPQNAGAWCNLGLATAALGQEKEALAYYGKALQIDPQNGFTHYNLGLLFARRGDAENALEHLARAFAAAPDPASPERRAMLGDLQAATLPAALRQDPRFVALLTGAGGTVK